MDKRAKIIKCKNEAYDILYLPDSFQIAKIGKEVEFEQIQTHIPSVEDKVIEQKKRHLSLGAKKLVLLLCQQEHVI